MNDRMTVAVYGATGHTGRFVVAELARRGLRAIRIGRDAARLAEDGGDTALARVAAIDDPAALDAALRGAAQGEAPGLRGAYRLLQDEAVWNAITPVLDGLKAFAAGLDKQVDKPISAFSGKPSES